MGLAGLSIWDYLLGLLALTVMVSSAFYFYLRWKDSKNDADEMEMDRPYSYSANRRPRI